NHLGQNATLSLYDAARNRFSSHRDNSWKATLPVADAQAIARELLLTGNDRLVDAELAPVRRDFQPPADGQLAVRNVVVILMESFAGRYVGALGSA
ncbi:hypothetical protein KXT63_24760, partial [Salmonella enterica subsp. enterica serovar Weltevreden]|nr:hypothetical protein [Salmonella enterica subsp. enterica serovar Weltevreden]